MKTFKWLTTGVLAALVVLLPLPKAGMVEWAGLSFVATVLLLLVIYLFVPLFQQQKFDGWWVLVWLCYTAICAAHYFGWINVFAGYFSPAVDGGLQDKSAFDQLRFVDRENILRSWILFSSYWTVVLLTKTLSHRHIMWILVAIIISASFQSMYGLFSLATRAETILGVWEKVVGLSSASGTFVNRNHMGGFLVVCMPLTMAWLLSRRGAVSGALPILKKSGLALFLLLSILAIVGSHSRATLVVGLLVILLFFMLSAFIQNEKSSKQELWSIWILFGSAICAAVWYGLGTVLTRFLLLPDGISRVDMWREFLELPLSVWIQGVGPGQFQFVYPLVQQTYPVKNVVYAHNDYLQFMLELGLVGAAAITIAFFGWIYTNWPRSMSKLQIGALSSIISIAVLSIVDFHLRIPALALVFWIAVGILTNRGSDGQPVNASKTGKSAKTSRLKRVSRQHPTLRFS